MALSKDLESVMDFDYMTFMEDRGLVGVPETCFSHVEASHDTGIKENMVVELQLPGEAQKFWLATIVNTHCALLSLTLVGDKEGSKPLWHDLSKKPLYPLGWCQRNKIDLEPPDEIKARVGNWQDLALQYLEDISIDTLDLHHVDAANGGGLTPAERLKVLYLYSSLVRNYHLTNLRLAWLWRFKISAIRMDFGPPGSQTIEEDF